MEWEDKVKMVTIEDFRTALRLALIQEHFNKD
jgi:hypothetical protein